MFITEEKSTEISASSQTSNLITVWKLTALWAFSEAALGGILHAFKIPLRGIFVGGSAAILISLIAYFSEKKGTILKSTILVILVKGFVSPHTPLTAYFAVFLQGLIGEVLFFNKKFFKLSALSLGILTLLFSSVQKILILTIIFGNTLWESIDDFANFIVTKFVAQDSMVSINFSYVLIGIYVGLHVLVGIFVGLFAGKFPYRIKDVIEDESFEVNTFQDSRSKIVKNKNRKHKRWWQRPSGLFVFSFALAMVILSFFYPELGTNKAYEIMIMMLRAVVIMIIWYTLIGPFLLKHLKRLMKKKQSVYSAEITNIVDIFPHLRAIVSYCWKISSTEKGYRKIRTFLIYMVSFILLTDFKDQ